MKCSDSAMAENSRPSSLVNSDCAAGKACQKEGTWRFMKETCRARTGTLLITSCYWLGPLTFYPALRLVDFDLLETGVILLGNGLVYATLDGSVTRTLAEIDVGPNVEGQLFDYAP